MAYVIGIDQTMVTSENILLNAPALKVMNVAPELPTTERLRANGLVRMALDRFNPGTDQRFFRRRRTDRQQSKTDCKNGKSISHPHFMTSFESQSGIGHELSPKSLDKKSNL